MLSLQDIIEFCNHHDYDLRKSGYGRWIDQKCTPDVVWSVSDFVLNYVDTVSPQFTPTDIWKSEYAKLTIAETFSKPGTDEKTAENEYDKVFSQPLNLFWYAGILKDVGTKGRHLYEIENREVLEFIARNDVYSLRFLQCYIEKVLRDSGLYRYFETFFDNQNDTQFNILKQAFIDFYHEYTPIKKEFEPKRIFTKVLNPLAFKNSKRGTERGRMSPHIINRSDMMYNQDNFRDAYSDKPKGVTRQEWLAAHPQVDRRDGYFEQMMNRAKRILKDNIAEYRNRVSELTQFVPEFDDYVEATQMHHIFPKHEFPEIMHHVENLIALTPNQHYGLAHPMNNTQIIDIGVQKTLLVAKTLSIAHNLSGNEDPIYDFSTLLYVLRVGLDDESVLEITDGDYNDVLHCINMHY